MPSALGGCESARALPLLAGPLAAECPGSNRLEEALILIILANAVLLAEGPRTGLPSGPRWTQAITSR